MFAGVRGVYAAAGDEGHSATDVPLLDAVAAASVKNAIRSFDSRGREVEVWQQVTGNRTLAFCHVQDSVISSSH